MIISYNSSSISFLIVRILFSVFASPSNLLLLILSIIVLIISLVPIILCYQLRALALLLSLLGVYTILNLYYPSISAYLTYLQLSTLVVVKLTRFLQSINIISSKQLSIYTLQYYKHVIIASSSLSCTSYRSLGPKNFRKQYTIGYYLFSYSQLVYPPSARSNALVLKRSSFSTQNMRKYSSLILTYLSCQKASSASLLQVKGISFRVSLVKGIVIFKQSLMNC